ncbi:MAG: TIGR02444 family protein [Pseudomonadota bacterium]
MIIGADSTDRDEGNPFWRFSLTLYAETGVADACLALQDRYNLDINLLLYGCYLANQGHLLETGQASALDQYCTEWRETVVRPVRALRRALKHQAPDVAEKLLAAELVSERDQQAMIWRWHLQQSWQADAIAGDGELLRRNLARLIECENAPAAAVNDLSLQVAGLLPVTVPQR